MMNNNRYILLVLIFVVLIVGVLGCAQASDTTTTTASTVLGTSTTAEEATTTTTAEGVTTTTTEGVTTTTTVEEVTTTTAAEGTTTTTSTTTTTHPDHVWTYVTEQIYYSSPAIGDDGTIYIGTGRSSLEVGILLALTPSGTLEWEHEFGLGTAVRGAPAIGASNTIYCMVIDNLDSGTYLYAINGNDGSLKWNSDRLSSGDPGGAGDRTPAISSLEVIYAPSTENLHAFNSDGTVRWTFTQEGNVLYDSFSAPALGPDGTIYSNVYLRGGGEPHALNGLYAINPDGTLQWIYQVTSEGYTAGVSPPSIDEDGTIYFGRGVGFVPDEYLFALNPDGSLKWKFYTAGLVVMSSPTIGEDGTIYVGTTSKGTAQDVGQSGIFFALNSDGTEQWRYDTTDDFLALGELFPDAQTDIYSSATIGADGTIYFSTEGAYIYALNPDGTVKHKYDMFAISPRSYGSSSIVYSSVAIANDGTIYAGDYFHYWSETGSHEGAVYALTSESYGLADTPWPRIHNNHKNTGGR